MQNKFLILLLPLFLIAVTSTAQCDDLIKDTKEYSRRAIEKTEYLSRYIQVISDRSSSRSDVASAIDLACKLFLDEERIVQVSSVNRSNVKTYKIREYFNHLQLLPYTRIEIDWIEIGYVSNLRKGTDGKYYGVITIKQKFTGYNGDLPTYQDVTVKHIEVVLKQVDVGYGGEMIQCWEVFLGNISVKETRKR